MQDIIWVDHKGKSKSGVDWDKYCEPGSTGIIFDFRWGSRDSVLDMRVCYGTQSKYDKEYYGIKNIRQCLSLKPMWPATTKLQEFVSVSSESSGVPFRSLESKLSSTSSGMA